jgi:Zn-dependent peptidase ImmA (M78 family)
MPQRRIEALVKNLLEEHRIQTPPVAVEPIARKLGAEIRYIPFQGKGEISGMVFREEGGRAVIGVNSLHHQNRQRFTIAHEIGHLLLHKHRDVHVDKALFRDDVASQATDPNEIAANRFAAELLMPKHLLMADLAQDVDLENEDDLLGLARRYRVSVQALTFRLANLGLINPAA